MSEPLDLAERYALLWNETDEQRRRDAIREFFTPHAEHFVGTREVRGYDAVEARIRDSHEKNVRDGGNRFRAVGNAQRLRHIVTFTWEMYPAGAPDQVSAVGLEFIALDEAGKAVSDYQFILR